MFHAQCYVWSEPPTQAVERTETANSAVPARSPSKALAAEEDSLVVSSKLIPIALAATLVVFGAMTAWAMTVTGIFEPSAIDVEHFDAGAGNDLLLLRARLVLVASGLAVIWALHRGSIAIRLKRVAVVPSVFLILIWSVASLNRFAPGYSEEKFLEVLQARQNGQLLTFADVTARLGSPLVTASEPGGRMIWSYTYTPSGGFGWDKRTLTFDSRGVLVEVLHTDEP
jgi:hypothetical protein